MTTQRITIPIDDLDCGAAGAQLLERAVARTPGVIAAYVNPALEMAYITFDPARCTPEQVSATVAACGFHTGLEHAEPPRDRTPLLSASQPAPTADAPRLATRLKVAELTGSIGAGVLGAGLALLLPAALAGYALPILILGALMHGWGMLDKHRLEILGGGPRPAWTALLYWGCWIALAGLGIALLRSYLTT